MTDNTKKYQIISLLKMYNLDYIVNFPTRINAYTETTILDRSKNENFIIEPYYNGLSDHDAQMLTFYIPSHKSFKPDLEVHHPHCVGSVTKNFVYYTYSRTRLYFTY